MKPHLIVSAAAACLLAASPAAAGVSGFAIVNAVGKDISVMLIRRVGSRDWKPLGAAPAAGKAASTSFSDPDCAFDLRATLVGGATLDWPGVNLCAVKLVTLRRNDAGLVWVDYD